MQAPDRKKTGLSVRFSPSLFPRGPIRGGGAAGRGQNSRFFIVFMQQQYSAPQTISASRRMPPAITKLKIGAVKSIFAGIIYRANP